MVSRINGPLATTVCWQDVGHLDTWLFDLDNTLYPATSSLFPQIDARMKSFIAKFLNVTPDEAYAVQKRYYREYGTSLRGLMLVNGLEPDEFLAYVHDIDHTVLEHDPVLDKALSDLPGRKLIFTNGSERHAEQTLNTLGLSHHFDGIFDVKAAEFVPKPEPAIYQKVIDRFGLVPQCTAFFEDSHLNLKPAAALGMTTVLVRSGPDHAPLALTPDDDLGHCQYIIEDIAGWLEMVAELFRQNPRP